MLAIAAMMIAAHVSDPLDTGDPGTTSVVALLVCYALGATIWFGYTSIAVMLAVATTVLLYFKAQLHGISKSMTHVDLLSILQFGVLALVILPILPDRDFGPYQALNPHNIWWMVVLISGVSLAGYTALRLTGAQHGAALIGLFGGLASSTATTMIFARHARANIDMGTHGDGGDPARQHRRHGPPGRWFRSPLRRRSWKQLFAVLGCGIALGNRRHSLGLAPAQAAAKPCPCRRSATPPKSGRR
jgi:hypothetical protein